MAIAQVPIRFAYDECGNRVKRELVITTVQKAAQRQSNDKSYYDPLGQRTIKLTHDPFGHIRIDIIDFQDTDVGIVNIYSINGALVLSQEISDGVVYIDISGQSAGIYLLTAVLNGNQTAWKITKS